jgi:outer membrane protein TolC
MKRLNPPAALQWQIRFCLALLACLSTVGLGQAQVQNQEPMSPAVEAPAAGNTQPQNVYGSTGPRAIPAPLHGNAQVNQAQQPAGAGSSIDTAVPLSPLSDESLKPLEQRPVTLFDEQQMAEGASLLNRVLVGSVTKAREYPIDLPTVLKLVEVQNLPIQRDRLGSKINSNLYYRSLSDLLPDIQGTYNQSRFQGAIQIFGNQTLQVYQTRIVPQLTARWTIYPGGQDVFNALAARQRAKGAKVQVLDTLQDQLTQAANEYYDLLAAGIQVANINLSIQEAQSQVTLNEARLKAGVGTRLDLERARSQLVQREQALINAENTLAKAQQTLLNRLNLDPDVGLVAPQVAAQPRLLVPLTVQTDQLVAKAITNHPSLKITDREVKALRHEARAVLSRLVPSVTLQTYINGTGPEIDKLGLGRFGGFTLQADLAENLGLAIPLDYRTRRLQVRQQLINRQQQVRDVQTQVINGFLDSRASAKAVLTAQEELAVAQEAYRLAFGRFRAGLGINVDVLDAENALNTARTNVVSAILAFNQAQVRLLRSLGEVSTEHLLNGIKLDAFSQPPPVSPSK